MNHLYQYFKEFSDILAPYPGASEFCAIAVIFLIAWIVNFAVKMILVKGVTRFLNATFLKHLNILGKGNIIARLANLVPPIVIYRALEKLSSAFNIHDALTTTIELVCVALIILTIGRVISSGLDIVNTLWNRRRDAASRPIKGYLQVVKIIVFAICVILIAAKFAGQSPMIILSGLGAMAAVLMLIFQDTLLSLVASVQITSNNMIRLGDWIEMPQLNVDGEVVDIALHTVTVQNWDKTLATIPIKKFMTDSFKNWRGMEEAGGRRIKRSVYIDQNSIHFLTSEEQSHFKRFHLLTDYMGRKEEETLQWNKKLREKNIEPVNDKRITNIGTFRAYVEYYLKQHPNIHQELTILVRQMPLTAEGLPLELYCFTNITNWNEYESIQADIFDHLLAIMPEFGLKVFQDPSGLDMRNMGNPFGESK